MSNIDGKLHAGESSGTSEPCPSLLTFADHAGAVIGLQGLEALNPGLRV